MVINDHDYLRSMMHDDGDNVTVRFYRNNQPVYYQVSKKLIPTESAIKSDLWVRILEKAIACYLETPTDQKRIEFKNDFYHGKISTGCLTKVVEAFYPDDHKLIISHQDYKKATDRDTESISHGNTMRGNYSFQELEIFFEMQQALNQKGGIIMASDPKERKLYHDQHVTGHAFSVIQCLSNQRTAEGRLVNLVTLRNPWGNSVDGAVKYQKNDDRTWSTIKVGSTNNNGIFTVELSDLIRLFGDIEIAVNQN